MKGIFRELTFCQLSLVVTVDEQTKVFNQGLQPSRKTTRAASQALEVMSQVRIDSFHSISFLFVGSHFIGSSIIQSVINWKGI